MSSLIRGGGPLVISFGTGVVIGASATYVYMQLSRCISRDLASLIETVQTLRRDIEELRSYIIIGQQLKTKTSRSLASGNQEIRNSSAEEDDDVYEEAYGGSDADAIRTIESSGSFRTVSSEPLFSNGSSDIEVEQFFEGIDKLLEGSDGEKEDAYHLLGDKKPLLSRNADFMWRLGKATYFVGQIEASRGNDDSGRTLIYKAKDFADRALALDDSIANVHKWYAITLGSIGDYEGTQAKIENGYKFKEHIERAIELSPEDPSAHYLLGRWCYGVYMLTWIERRVAATLFATPPTATVEEALEHFLEAERLKPGSWKENMLFIAKCNIEQREYTSAAVWLRKADDLPAISQDDKKAQEEIDTLLATYGEY